MTLLVTILIISFLSAAGLGLSLAASANRDALTNHQEAIALLNASESALELAVRDLGTADWNDVLRGATHSAFWDGPSGVQTLPSGASLDLRAITNRLTCGRVADCSEPQRRMFASDRPWGANNPRWQLYLHGRLDPPLSPRATQPVYVAVWIGDDGYEADGDPLSDGAGPAGEGRYIIRARAEAFGARGARHAIEAELARRCYDDGGGTVCAPGTSVQSWQAVTTIY